MDSNLLIQAKFSCRYSRTATKAGFSPGILLLTGGSEVKCTCSKCTNLADRLSGSHQSGPPYKGGEDSMFTGGMMM